MVKSVPEKLIEPAFGEAACSGGDPGNPRINRRLFLLSCVS